jgi:transcription elongation factor Elf1
MAESVRTLDEAVAKLRTLPCPRCLTLGALAIMQCGPGKGDCDYLGLCETCGHRFDLEWGAKVLARLEHDTQVRERLGSCPACRSPRPEVQFACDTKARSCFFVATCSMCGETFSVPLAHP